MKPGHRELEKQILGTLDLLSRQRQDIVRRRLRARVEVLRRLQELKK